MRRGISFLLVFSILFASMLTNNSYVYAAQNNATISLSLDSNRIKEVGEIITATVEVKDVPNFAGYQFNLKYDPEVLQPVKANGSSYTKSTPVEGGMILNSDDYGILSIGSHDLKKGELNFSKCYLSFHNYKESGNPEETGVIAVIRFKVLKEEATSLEFADTKTMPGAKSGVYLFDWDGNRINNFDIKQPQTLLGSSSISVSLDTDKITKVGQIIKASVNVEDINNLAGFQYNIKYDPEVLQPVKSNGTPYNKGTTAESGDLLSNPEFGIFAIGDNDLNSGVINQSKCYMNFETYKNSGSSESTGTISVVYFKVLKVKETSISFAPHKAMPGAKEGTFLFDWNGVTLKDYSVLKDVKISAEEEIIIVKPEIISVKADKTSPQLEGTIITWTCEATGENLEYAWLVKKDGKEVEKTNFENKNSFSYKAEKEGNYQVTVTVKDSYGNEVSKTADEFVIEKEEEVVTGEISLSVDKDKVTKKGEIVTVTINAKDIQNIAGYQVNLKYDPKVLEPVTDNGTAYSKRTFPTNGTLINNNSYSSVQAVANDLDNGILNFGKTYVYLDKYRASGVGESTGTIAIIKFKVLDVKPTTISFEDTASMPGAVDGTLMFNWNGDKTTSYTVSKSVSIDAEEEEEVIGEISLSADKDKVTKKGEIVTVTINAKDIQNIAGYQVNLKYDPKVLEPVTDNGTAYSKRTFPTNGTLINNNSYSSVQAVANDLDNGILNFGKTYVYLDKYRASGVGESIGTIAIIKFKVLDVKPTTISFEDTASMPGAVDGTLMFNWNGDKTTSYTVSKSVSIDAEEEEEVIGEISLSADKDKVTKKGEIVTVTINAKDIQNIAGYQVNLKYDPKVLEPVTDNGTAYSKRTFPTNGTLINNNSYSSVQAVANDLDNGILNFGKTYVYLDKYRASGVGESTGTIAIIKFKVLDVKPTTISFEDTASMPGAVDGTLMFNWNGDKTTSYTVVKSVSIDAEEEVIIVKPEIVSVKADKTSPQLEGTTITWTCEATGENLEYAWLVKKDGKEVEKTNFASNNSFSYKAEEKGNYQATVTVKDSYGNEVSKESDTFVIEEKKQEFKGVISIDLDKNRVTQVGDIVTATINVRDFDNLSGYEIHLRYDPKVLQPITSDGKAYGKRTFPEDGTMILNPDYQPLSVVSNIIEEGLLVFGKIYIGMNDYREDNVPEGNGSLAVVRFKVLEVEDTTIRFADDYRDVTYYGTLLFNWNGDELGKHKPYKVIKEAHIYAE